MNRILSSIVNAGAAMPLLKELVSFSGLDTAKIGQTIQEYASGLNRNAVSDVGAERDLNLDEAPGDKPLTEVEGQDAEDMSGAADPDPSSE